MATSKVTITNTAKGLRGVHTVTGFVNLEPGETRTVELAAGETIDADTSPYFSTDGAPVASDDGDTDSNLNDNSVGELEKIAADEGVDVDGITGTGANGRVVKADLVAAIEAKRAGGAGDGLDAMSDDDLRATVKTLTGEDAPADADRTALLALARGENE